MPIVRRSRSSGQIAPRHYGSSGSARPPEQPGLPRQIYNPGNRGQDARYDVRALPRNDQGQHYDNYGNTYDQNGLLIGGSRPRESLAGLRGADNMNGDQWGDYLNGASGGAPGAGGAGGGGGGGGLGAFAGDPALQQILAMGARSREAARSQHLASRKQAALEYGDAGGLGLDDVTMQAARENPFSVIARREQERGETLFELEEALNQGNLFYSGYRGTELGRHDTTYQGFAYDDANRYRALQQSYDDALARALLDADYRELEYLMSLGPDDYGGGYGDEDYEEIDVPYRDIYRSEIQRLVGPRSGGYITGTSPRQQQTFVPGTGRNVKARLRAGRI